MNVLVNVIIKKGIHKGKSKVSRKQKLSKI